MSLRVMSALLVAALLTGYGAFVLVRRDRLVAANLDAWRRWKLVRRVPLIGKWYGSPRFQRAMLLLSGIGCIASAAYLFVARVMS